MTTLFRRLIDELELRDPRAFLPRFREQARLLAERDGDVRLATLEPAVSTFEAWYYGQRLPNRDARRVLVAWFGHSMERLWAPAGEAAVAARGGAFDREGADLHEMRRGAVMAARRARDFALGAEQGQLGDETLGYLQDEVRRITEQYPRVPLPMVFDDLAAAQSDAFRLIEGGRARPSQMRQLHVLATLLSWHMAKACHDLGDESSAMMHARAAGVSAEQAEHPALSALVHGLKSLISYWSGRGPLQSRGGPSPRRRARRNCRRSAAGSRSPARPAQPRDRRLRPARSPRPGTQPGPHLAPRPRAPRGDRPVRSGHSPGRRPAALTVESCHVPDQPPQPASPPA